MEKGDLLVLVSAFFWTAHVILVGRWTAQHDSLTLAALQFAAVAVLSGAVAAGWETTTWAGLQGALWAILYGGLISVGVGYTLQVVAQQYALPAHAAIIMSLETVFATKSTNPNASPRCTLSRGRAARSGRPSRRRTSSPNAAAPSAKRNALKVKGPM
jgi:hypothetical protein